MIINNMIYFIIYFQYICFDKYSIIDVFASVPTMLESLALKQHYFI